jgi:excisionase family DNA binding protein
VDVTSFTVGRGDDVELTTQEAAQLLCISPTYLDRLVEEGHVPAHLVGTGRRLKASDVMRYGRARERRLAQVAAISQADSELGIPY